MTFSADAITACEVNAAGETPDIGDKAAQELAGLIVSEQNVDAVKASLAGHLDNTVVLNPDGTKKKLKQKD